MADLLWPAYDGPVDLAEIEAVPLADRGVVGRLVSCVICDKAHLEVGR